MDDSRVVGSANHGPADSRPSSWPHSGRGERRPQTARAARTNDPLALPEGLRGRGQSPQGRRWRDLAQHYSALLGPERIKHEPTVAKLRALIWTTLEAERLSDMHLRGEPVAPHTVMNFNQEVRMLLRELGLGSAETSDKQPALHDYLRGKNGAPP